MTLAAWRPSRRSDIVFAAILAALGAVIVAASQGYREPADRFPTIFGIMLVILTGVEIVRAAFVPEIRPDVAPIRAGDGYRGAVFYGSLWAVGILTVLIGFALGGFLWAFSILRGVYGWTLWGAAAWGAGLMAVIAIVFPALGLDLPAGLLARAR